MRYRDICEGVALAYSVCDELTKIVALSSLWGETIVPCGSDAANRFGLTTQVPVQPTYLTSGPNRRLTFGELVVHLRHAPRWQLVVPYRPAGDAVRALAWLRPESDSVGLRKPAVTAP